MSGSVRPVSFREMGSLGLANETGRHAVRAPSALHRPQRHRAAAQGGPLAPGRRSSSCWSPRSLPSMLSVATAPQSLLDWHRILSYDRYHDSLTQKPLRHRHFLDVPCAVHAGCTLLAAKRRRLPIAARLELPGTGARSKGPWGPLLRSPPRGARARRSPSSAFWAGVRCRPRGPSPDFTPLFP
jgi:hypothetical protein